MGMQLLLRSKGLKERSLSELKAAEAALSARRTELDTKTDSIETEEDLASLSDEVTRNDEDIAENKRQQLALQGEIGEIGRQIEDLNKRSRRAVGSSSDGRVSGDPENRMSREEMRETRGAINTYLRTRANPDGVDSSTVGVTIPVEVLYKPEDEIKTVVDLSKYVTVHPVKTAKGKYPIRKKANAKLSTVQELKKNPKLADPQFLEVEWSVDTHRGAIAISQESIDDSEIDLVPLIAKDAEEQKLNTKNAKIAEVLRSFTSLTATSLDDIKAIKNKKLDRAYSRMIIASASFYHAVDTLKDKQGRYLLQEDIKSPTGHVFLGMPIEVIDDEYLGAEDEAKAFIGDCKRGVLLSDRKDLEVRWVDHDIYGEYLRAGMRFGVTKADDKAGYLITYVPETETP